MNDPIYIKYVVVPTSQCNYTIYCVKARHAVSTTGAFHIDNANNHRNMANKIKYKTTYYSHEIFDTRGEADVYAQQIVMPKILKDKIADMERMTQYYSKLHDKFKGHTPKAKFSILAKDLI